jgi:hypothetical protein
MVVSRLTRPQVFGSHQLLEESAPDICSKHAFNITFLAIATQVTGERSVQQTVSRVSNGGMDGQKVGGMDNEWVEGRIVSGKCSAWDVAAGPQHSKNVVP